MEEIINKTLPSREAPFEEGAEKMSSGEQLSSTSKFGSAASSIHDSDFSNDIAFFGDGPGLSPDVSSRLKTHGGLGYPPFEIGASSESNYGSSRSSEYKKYFSHPEGSFMAFCWDKSEENVEELIKRTVSKSDNTDQDKSTLHDLLPEVREPIWNHLSPLSLLQIRLTCKKFRDEIDNEVGVTLYFCDNDDDSLRLALTLTIQRLIICHLEMSSISKLILCNPLKLKSLRIKSRVSNEAVHVILLRCPNIEHIEIDHHYIPEENNAAIRDWIEGKLFKPEEEIKYAYGCFNKLRSLCFHTNNDNSVPTEVRKQILVSGLIPLLCSVNSQLLQVIDISVHVAPEDSKLLTGALFDVFLKSRNLKTFRLKHYRSESYTFEPIPNVDQDRKTSQYVLKFSAHRPFPQFQELYLEMPEYVHGFFDWLYLMKNQRELRSLTWDVGGNYWLYPVESIGKSAKTLEYLMLRMIRCYQIVNDEILSPEPLSMGHFHEFIALKTFHIIGTELPTSQFCRMDLLPKNIVNLQIECFQIAPEQLQTIHKTLSKLKFLSINHWNKTREDFLTSLAIIGEMIAGKPSRNYKALTFLEKCMYTVMTQLEEINQVLDNLKIIALSNDYLVDEISGDNGIGFILVINSVPASSNQSTLSSLA